MRVYSVTFTNGSEIFNFVTKASTPSGVLRCAARRIEDYKNSEAGKISFFNQSVSSAQPLNLRRMENNGTFKNLGVVYYYPGHFINYTVSEV